MHYVIYYALTHSDNPARSPCARDVLRCDVYVCRSRIHGHVSCIHRHNRLSHPVPIRPVPSRSSAVAVKGSHLNANNAIMFNYCGRACTAVRMRARRANDDDDADAGHRQRRQRRQHRRVVRPACARVRQRSCAFCILHAMRCGPTTTTTTTSTTATTTTTTVIDLHANAIMRTIMVRVLCEDGSPSSQLIRMFGVPCRQSESGRVANYPRYRPLACLQQTSKPHIHTHTNENQPSRIACLKLD